MLYNDDVYFKSSFISPPLNANHNLYPHVVTVIQILKYILLLYVYQAVFMQCAMALTCWCSLCTSTTLSVEVGTLLQYDRDITSEGASRYRYRCHCNSNSLGLRSRYCSFIAWRRQGNCYQNCLEGNTLPL